MRKPNLVPGRRWTDHARAFRRGLVGAWIFETGGGFTPDWSGVNNHGTWENSDAGMASVIGEHGRAFEHTGDGTNDRIELGSITGSNPLKLTGATDCTILARVYLDGSPTSAFPRLIDVSDGGSATNGWQLFVISGDWSFQVAGGASFTSSSTVPTDQWSTVAMVINGGFPAGGRKRYFINGTVDHDTTITNLTTPPSNTTPGCLFNRNNSTDRQWTGFTDYIYVYNRALSDAEIHYIQSVDPYAPVRQRAFVPAYVPEAGGGFQAAWAQGSNVLIGAAL